MATDPQKEFRQALKALQVPKLPDSLASWLQSDAIRKMADQQARFRALAQAVAEPATAARKFAESVGLNAVKPELLPFAQLEAVRSLDQLRKLAEDIGSLSRTSSIMKMVALAKLDENVSQALHQITDYNVGPNDSAGLSGDSPGSTVTVDSWANAEVIRPQVAPHGHRPVSRPLIDAITLIVAILVCIGTWSPELLKRWADANYGSAAFPLLRVERKRVIRSMDMRLNPRFNSPRVGHVKAGEVLIVVKIDASKSWTMIETKNQHGQLVLGWVFSRYLERLD